MYYMLKYKAVILNCKKNHNITVFAVFWIKKKKRVQKPFTGSVYRLNSMTSAAQFIQKKKTFLQVSLKRGGFNGYRVLNLLTLSPMFSLWYLCNVQNSHKLERTSDEHSAKIKVCLYIYYMNTRQPPTQFSTKVSSAIITYILSITMLKKALHG